MKDYIKAMNDAAMKVLGTPPSDTTEFYDYERITGGIICRGSDMKVVTRGKNKGSTMPVNTNKVKVIVTKQQIDAELDLQQTD